MRFELPCWRTCRSLIAQQQITNDLKSPAADAAGFFHFRTF
jgi:hypothetical protein